MTITFNDDGTEIMDAELINDKDDLQGSIYSVPNHNKKGTNFVAYIGKLSSENQEDYFKVYVFKSYIDDNISVQKIVPIVNNGLYHINTPALQHGMNMIKGFFTSNKYRDYVMNHSKRGKLIAEKHELNQKLANVNRKLNITNEDY